MIKRHLAKTISYRLIGTLTTIVISYVMIGNLVLTSTLGAIELLVKPGIYFLHERFWYKYIKYGRKKV